MAIGFEGAGKDGQGAVKVKIAVIVHHPQKRSVLYNSCPPHTPASFQWERERAEIEQFYRTNSADSVLVRKTSVFLLSPWCHTRVTQRSLVQGDTGIHTKEPRRGSLHPAAGPSLTPSVQTKRKRCKNILYIYRDDLLKSRDGSRNSRAKTWQGKNWEGGG